MFLLLVLCLLPRSYHSMTKFFYREAQIGIVVYDITQRDSFNHAESWIEDFREQCPDANVVLVGNKCDIESQRQVCLSVVFRASLQRRRSATSWVCLSLPLSGWGWTLRGVLLLPGADRPGRDESPGPRVPPLCGGFCKDEQKCAASVPEDCRGMSVVVYMLLTAQLSSLFLGPLGCCSPLRARVPNVGACWSLNSTCIMRVCVVCALCRCCSLADLVLEGELG